MPTLEVRPQGPFGRFLDAQFEGTMRYVLGVPNEATQRTHRWNNHHLKEAQLAHLRTEWMVSHLGDPQARSLRHIPVLSGTLAHLTRFGGWQRYIVVAPKNHAVNAWYVGWRWHGGGGVSRVPSTTAVRVLVGKEACEWFAIEAVNHAQTPLVKVGEGTIGEGGPLAQLPLF